MKKQVQRHALTSEMTKMTAEFCDFATSPQANELKIFNRLENGLKALVKEKIFPRRESNPEYPNIQPPA
jgi:hypothetical protein